MFPIKIIDQAAPDQGLKLINARKRVSEFNSYIAMKSILTTLILIILSTPVHADDNSWRIKSIKENYAIEVPFLLPTNTVIEFANGHMAKTDVVEFKLIDSFNIKDDNYIMYSGRTCTECDMRTSLYISSSSNDEYSTEQYGYPGKITYYLDGSPLQESRMFYGQCLNEDEITVIFYTYYLGTDEIWHKSVYDIDFEENKVIKNPEEIPYDLLSTTEELVKKGICQELDGKDGHSEP